MLDVGFNVPWWLPLSVLVWAVQMAVFHGIGLFFEWSGRTGMLASFKVRDIDRLGYFELLPRVLFNQILVLLPAMIAFQYTGLAFTGAPHLTVLHFLAGMAIMGVGQTLSNMFSIDLCCIGPARSASSDTTCITRPARAKPSAPAT